MYPYMPFMGGGVRVVPDNTQMANLPMMYMQGQRMVQQQEQEKQQMQDDQLKQQILQQAVAKGQRDQLLQQGLDAYHSGADSDAWKQYSAKNPGLVDEVQDTYTTQKANAVAHKIGAFKDQLQLTGGDLNVYNDPSYQKGLAPFESNGKVPQFKDQQSFDQYYQGVFPAVADAHKYAASAAGLTQAYSDPKSPMYHSPEVKQTIDKMNQLRDAQIAHLNAQTEQAKQGKQTSKIPPMTAILDQVSNALKNSKAVDGKAYSDLLGTNLLSAGKEMSGVISNGLHSGKYKSVEEGIKDQLQHINVQQNKILSDTANYNAEGAPDSYIEWLKKNDTPANRASFVKRYGQLPDGMK